MKTLYLPNLRDSVNLVMPQLRQRLLDGTTDVFVVATGAGAGIQKHLWDPAGASSFLIGGAFTYWPQETDAFLGFRPESYCTADTAVDLAAEAYVRAKMRSYADTYNPRPAMGIAVTAAVASKNPRRGDSRVHIAIVSDHGCRKVSYLLEKGVGDEARQRDEETCTYAALDLIQVVLGLKYAHEDQQEISQPTLRSRLLYRPYFTPMKRTNRPSRNQAFFPGAFNPIQPAHRFMAESIVQRRYASSVAYTICVDHKHKPPLSGLDMLARVACFRAEQLPDDGLQAEPHLYFTMEDPLFVDKMRVMPGQKWIMGADTFHRILDPKWGPSPSDVLHAVYKTDSQLFVFACDHEGRRLTVDGALTDFIPDWEKFQFPAEKLITEISDAELPTTRSTQVRAEAAARAGAAATGG